MYYCYTFLNNLIFTLYFPFKSGSRCECEDQAFLYSQAVNLNPQQEMGPRSQLSENSSFLYLIKFSKMQHVLRVQAYRSLYTV